MRIHALQHVSFELEGSIGGWAREKGHRLSATRLYAEEALSDMAEIDRLPVLGGPMNLYVEDPYPWPVEEKRFIQRAIENGKIVPGICLGAQLAADVLGARVVHNGYKKSADDLDDLVCMPTYKRFHGLLLRMCFSEGHVMKQLNSRLTQLRTAYQKGLSPERRSVTKGSRWLLVKNRSDLSPCHES